MKVNKVLVALDLESVLIPEIWPFLAKQFNLKDLSLTTREVKDFKKLTDLRFKALNSKMITLEQIKKALRKLKPLPGTEELLGFLHQNKINYVVITDSFEEFLTEIIKDLKITKILANSILVKEEKLYPVIKIGGKKGEILAQKVDLSSLDLIGIGDSFNDISLLKVSKIKILVNPSSELRKLFPQAILVKDTLGILAILKPILT